MDGWHIIDKDGSPPKDGEYMVVTISYEYKDNKRTGRGIAMVESSFYEEGEGWVLTYSGFVYAWREIPSDLPEIPDWCIWGYDEDE